MDYMDDRFGVEPLTDGRWAVLCVRPFIADDGTDCTVWPDESEVSQYIGQRVKCIGPGDHPDFPEALYEIDEGR